MSEWSDLILSKSCCKRIEVMWCTFIYVWVMWLYFESTKLICVRMLTLYEDLSMRLAMFNVYIFEGVW